MPVCDLCGHDKARSYPNPANNPRIVRCVSCGLVYTYPRPSDDEYLKVSATDPMVWRPPDFLEDREGARYRALLDELATLKSSGRFVEIGCGHGFTLKLARERGYEVYGVELQDHLADYARKELDLNVTTGELTDASFASEFFDIIIMWNVLEHGLSPTRLLEEVYRILRKGGIVSILVPNVESFNARKNPDWWSDYHFYHFSSRTVKQYMLKARLKTKLVVVNPHIPYSILPGALRYKLWGQTVAVKALRKISSGRLRMIWRRLPQGSLTVYGEKGPPRLTED